MVIDWSKYLNKILELNISEKYARVQPGTICDDVVKAGRPYDLTYAPDPATHDHCCFGGMLGNNSCGAHAQMNGPAVNNVESLNILLYDGTRMQVGWLSEAEWDERARGEGREGEIYAKLKSLRERYQALIQERYPKILRRISGCNLDQLIPNKEGMVNIARALTGSEGTCVTILEAKVTLIYSPPKRALLVLGYRDVWEAADHLREILPYKPLALEGIDDRLYADIRKKSGLHAEHLDLLPEGNGWLMVEFGGTTQEEANHAADELMQKLKSSARAPSMKVLEDEKRESSLWDVREAGLGATAFIPGERDTREGWEDSAVAPEKVSHYLRDLRALFDKYNYDSAMYGHFGQGCIHCRIPFDFRTEEGRKRYRSFMEEATDLIVRYGGAFSGEHGDGQSKAEFLGKIFGPELIEAFREFKSIWDPDWKMNPGKIVEPYRIDENLRLGEEYKPWEPETHFKFPDDHGSFAHATMRCVGVGKCRRTSASGLQDTMCPSFMVTREEKDTTRGRAHALFEMLNGDLTRDGWRDEGVKEALDLCLSCKGCKGDCPVNVDMATYKAEFLSHYWEGRIRPRSAYAFGWIDKWVRLASLAPGFVNLFTQLPVIREAAKIAAGVPHQRTIPAFAPETFKAWFRKQKRNGKGRAGNWKGNGVRTEKVILWADTFNNYFFPETAMAAVEVLESAGCDVVVPNQHLCCGRPLYDYGFLDMAEEYLQRIMEALGPEIERGTPMVVLEPSCCSVFRDELGGLFPHVERARKLKEQTFTLAEFLIKRKDYAPPTVRKKAILHGHCHNKAIMRLKSEEALLKKMGVRYSLPEAGCCGMAGSFGFEKDKYGVSVKAGERVLLPAVRRAEPETLIVADGFSCKVQIAQLTNRQALHTAEVLALATRTPDPNNEAYPERQMTVPRLKAQKKSMIRAGLITTAAAAGLGLLIFGRSRR